MNHYKEKELIQKGIELFNQNSLKQAFSIFEEAIQINPKNEDAYFYMANIFHIKGELGKAVKAFNKVLELNSSHTDASISLSVILNDIGKYDEAQRIFDSANEKIKNKSKGVEDPHINKKFALKHFELAEMYYSYNRYDEALFEYNKARSLNDDNLDVRVKIAKVYSKKGYLSKAFEELRSLKSDKPDYIPARIALGLLHYGKGNTIEAQSEWQGALLKDPENEELQMYLELSLGATETNLSV